MAGWDQGGAVGAAVATAGDGVERGFAARRILVVTITEPR